MNFTSILTQVFSHRDLIKLGYSAGGIAQQVKRQQLLPLLPGTYTTDPNYKQLKPYQQYPYFLAAAYRKNPATVFTHQSAAWLHGLALLGQGPVDIYSPPNSRGRPQGIRKHYWSKPPQILLTPELIRITSLEQTLRDCCCFLGPAAALITVESALFQGKCQAEDLAPFLARAAGRGRAKARLIAHIMSKLSESPGESLLKWILHSSHLPMPEQQVEVSAGGERFRLDFAYREQKLGIEFDGQVKYFDYGNTSQAVYDELRREKKLKNEGWMILRFDWSDVYSRPDSVIFQLAQALHSRS
ncbi:MAG: DUF559 domain-containing protein [Rothia sp. (in: high G+C Gram-positive bacteria)]|nr:DUF559 domain-containing protein [Rothia sp. (in: high G+C Gram-positive bacteria)]